MKFTKSSVTLANIQLICCILFAACNAVRVPINSNYILDYELINNNRSIEFRIQAVNVTGWVGIGINNKSAGMDGADIFIGGYNATSKSGYGNDYHVPIGGGNTRPKIDTQQNWDLAAAAESNNITILTVRRLLNTTDLTQDVMIQNQTMYLLWSFNWVTDSLPLSMHAKRGSIIINLLGNGEWSVPTTTTTTSTTIPKSNGASTIVQPAFVPAIILSITAKIIYLQ